MFGNRHGQRGFTLIESVIAMGLFAIGALGVMAMQVTAINANRFGGMLAQATIMCEERAALLLSLDFDDSRLNDSSPGNNPAIGGKFAEVAMTAADPSTVAESSLAQEGLARNGALLPIGTGEVYQRYWQISDEDVNVASAGADIKRIRVATRFRDGASRTWREASVIVIKARAQ